MLFYAERRPGRLRMVAFLLTQVGSSAAREFAKILEPLNFAPPDPGILGMLAPAPGMNQQELANRLGMHASRLVGVLDALEKRGLVAREPNPADRRFYSLSLTTAGRQALALIGMASQTHYESICRGTRGARTETAEDAARENR